MKLVMNLAFLTKPSIKYKQSFLEAVSEIQQEQSSNPFSAHMSENKIDVDALAQEENFQKFLDHLDKETRNPASGKKNGLVASAFARVPNTTLWLIDQDDNGQEFFVGRVNVRHHLNRFLRNSFGHLGYLVRPSARGLGYGSVILKLALSECKKIVTDLESNQGKILVSCRKDNLISKKLIIAAGGVLEKEVDIQPGSNAMASRELLFWIRL